MKLYVNKRKNAIKYSFFKLQIFFQINLAGVAIVALASFR